MGSYHDFKPKLTKRQLRQKAEKEARERQDTEDRAIMGELLAEEVHKRVEAEAKRKDDKESKRLAIKVAKDKARADAEAEAQARAGVLLGLKWLKRYSNKELDVELARRNRLPPTSVEAGIGYWEETSVEKLLEELTATPIDSESSKWVAESKQPVDRIVRTVDQFGRQRNMRLPPLDRPCSWAVRAWREWELALAIRLREVNPTVIFHRVIHTMSWDEFYRHGGKFDCGNPAMSTAE